VIQKCRMKNGHGGVAIGSEGSGGVRRVFVEDCTFDSPQLDVAVRIKNNAMRGNVIEHVFARNLRVGQVAQSVLAVDFHYEEAEQGPFTPVVRNVVLQHVTAKKADYALNLRGFANAPIRDVQLRDCVFDGVAKANVVEYVEGLSMRNVRINGKVVS